MKIEERDGKITLDGQGDLIISGRRTEYCLEVEQRPDGSPMTVKNLKFAKAIGGNRLARLWYLLKFIWPYTQ